MDLPAALRTMAARLVTVPGVVGVVLGGSRARGEGRPDSDWDLALFSRSCREVTSNSACR
ncbi:hypothetical protein C6N75_01080 [Streptomyces solincola]|uniref:Polymerase nucleotidyl transferase domain-containing protein n=1 Tax=Streptomyces solincola TaxID=2100817 RepID=A0A2S9Q2U7_9ACTN|nr:hypothetical protein C6N75_01080 [Streptomyces solincola]